MSIWKRMGIFGFLAVAELAWAANGVVVQVSLSPAGSFEAKTDSVAVKGSATRQGDDFDVKNVVVDLASLKTGIDLRDRHMREKYLETAKYPHATLVQGSGKGGKFTGDLTIRDVTKKIEGAYAFDGDRLEAKFKLKPSDFKIAKASYLGVGVEDEVEVVTRLDIPKSAKP